MTSNKTISVQICLGHRAALREHTTKEGYTHDWEVYVKGDGGNIQTFVDRVIFYLHESFPKPKRVVKEPPYCVKESGYAGFLLNIEIVFKTKAHPKQATFQYDLYLQQTGGPISPHRKEKLIFYNPNDELTKKLLAAGGVVLDSAGPVEKATAAANVHGGSVGSGGKVPKPSSTLSVAPSSKSSPTSFETLFGTPLKRSGPQAPLTSTVTSSKPPKHEKDKTSASKSKEKDLQDSVKSGSHSVPKKNEAKSSSKKTAAADILPASSSSSSSAKHSKSHKSSTSKQEKVPSKNMLPPTNTSVPKKAKKSDVYEPVGASVGSYGGYPSKEKEKVKKGHAEKASATSNKSKNRDRKDDVVLAKGHGKKPVVAELTVSKPAKSSRTSPAYRSSSSSSSSSSCSSSSSSNSSSARSSPVPNHSDDDSDSRANLSDSNRSLDEISPPSSNRGGKTSKGGKPPRKRSKKSVSPVSSGGRLQLSPAPSIPTAAKKRKNSPSVSSETSSPAQYTGKKSGEKSEKGRRGASPSKAKHKSAKKSYKDRVSPVSHKGRATSSYYDMEISSATDVMSPVRSPVTAKGPKRSEAVIAAPAENSTRNRGKTGRKNAKSSPLSKMYAESDDTSSSEEESSANSSGSSGGRRNSNHIVNHSGFSHAGVAGSITAEMKLLRDLHSRINELDDPDKLQKIVDIVETSGKDLWSTDSGITFDFDLCKLSSTTIRKLREAILS